MNKTHVAGNPKYGPGQKAMKLAAYAHDRDNNFSLIRIAAALSVLISHSFALAIGTGDAEPLRMHLGMTPGTIALDVFFLTSGFLVTGSLLRRQRIAEFFWARALRIYPALVAMVCLTVLVLGMLLTKAPLSLYFTDRNTYLYLVKNASLFTGVTYVLPGVFEQNPYTVTVNGSLWTMPFEISMYAILAAMWLFVSLLPQFRSRAFKFVIVSSAAVSGVWHIAGHLFFSRESEFTMLFFMFFTGAAFYLLKEHVTLSRPLFWFSVIALSLSAFERHAFFVVYNLTVAYILFFIAFVPSGPVRAFNRAGDYSYGIYLYAFPVQQSTAALVPGISVWSMMAVSSLVTLLLASLSWHMLEQHALKFKGLFTSRKK
jgi:peptidoglycan/LPS O-acetylase OafA/YrhL